MLSGICCQSHVTYPQPLSTYFSGSFSRRQNFVTFPFSASQLANTAYVIQFSFLILSGIILLTYVFSLLTCRIIYIKSHRYTFLISWFRYFRYFRIPERLLPSPGILSGYPSSAISHQRPHVSPEALRGDTLLSISPLYQLPIQYIFTAAGLYFINPLPASYV